MFKDRPEYDTPQYKAVRYAAFVRDGFSCAICGSKEKIAGHHIKTWAKHEKLRFVVSNIITLCDHHHDLVTGKEEEYEDQFRKIVEINQRKNQNGNPRKRGRKYIYRSKNPYQRY